MTLMSLRKNFKHLKSSKLLNYYKKYQNRLFFLNFHNSLNEETRDYHNIDNEIKRLKGLLDDLSQSNNGHNLIFVFSDKDISYYNKNLQNYSDKIGFAFESGFYYKYPNSNITELLQVNDKTWKTFVLKVLTFFTKATEGSFIEEKKSEIIWNYSQCDTYFAKIQANEIKTSINSFWGNISYEDNNNTLIIKQTNVNKAAFIAKIIQNEVIKGSINFICYIGDMNNDECAFTYLNSIEKYFGNFSKKFKIISATMGRKNSYAKYYFKEIFELIDDLDMLAHSK